MSRFMICICGAVLLISNAASAQQHAGLKVGQGSTVYVRAFDKGEYLHVAKLLNYWNFWKVVDSKEAADFVIDVKTDPGWNYKAYAVIENARTGETVFKSKGVNTLWTIGTFNMKKDAMRKLVCKRLRRDYVKRQS